MEAEIINVLSFRYKKHCANVGRLANATLRHYSESSKHSWNSLRGQLSCSVLRLETLPNVSSRVAVREFWLKHANNENILCNRGLAQENQQRWCTEPLCWEFQHKYENAENILKTHKHLQWLGFPAHTMLAFKILDSIHWEFQWVKAILGKLRKTRWCLEVWNWNSSCFVSVCWILSISLGVPMQLREFWKHSRNSP